MIYEADKSGILPVKEQDSDVATLSDSTKAERAPLSKEKGAHTKAVALVMAWAIDLVTVPRIEPEELKETMSMASFFKLVNRDQLAWLWSVLLRKCHPDKSAKALAISAQQCTDLFDKCLTWIYHFYPMNQGKLERDDLSELQRATRLLALFKGGHDDGARAEDEPRNEPPASIAVLVVHDPADESLAQQLIVAIEPRLSVPVRTGSQVAEAEQEAKNAEVALLLVSKKLEDNWELIEAVAKTLPNSLVSILIDEAMAHPKHWMGALAWYISDDLFINFCKPTKDAADSVMAEALAAKGRAVGMPGRRSFHVFLSHDARTAALAAAVAALAAAAANLQPAEGFLFDTPCLASALDGECQTAVNLCESDATCSAALEGTESDDMMTAIQSTQALLSSELGSFVAACASCSGDACYDEFESALTTAFGNGTIVNGTLAQLQEYCPITDVLPDAQCIFTTCAESMLDCVEDPVCYGYLQELMVTTDPDALGALFQEAITQSPTILPGLTCAACSCPDDLTALISSQEILAAAQGFCGGGDTNAPSAASSYGASAVLSLVLARAAVASNFF
ncbi:Hypothetical Protein FCC1311_099142 [Hondaea fermentalgiana]|uniref:Uncharacterized protein n=1 Tax=Hondaea fermentalgiana TaxID=2315210 RepID=A0A2R5GYZ4_9STRA|nr:Hypothetical Protein FCC1311_099142 [Hondaea fermentalgiana]|eukprot:GBG33691.1 Hypothetical Protein FCC1311_099142 [Hondaea fermentalgiana]